jgi:hypothetical protein
MLLRCFCCCRCQVFRLCVFDSSAAAISRIIQRECALGRFRKENTFCDRNQTRINRNCSQSCFLVTRWKQKDNIAGVNTMNNRYDFAMCTTTKSSRESMIVETYEWHFRSISLFHPLDDDYGGGSYRLVVVRKCPLIGVFRCGWRLAKCLHARECQSESLECDCDRVTSSKGARLRGSTVRL